MFNFHTHMVKLRKHKLNGVELDTLQKVTLVDRVCMPPRKDQTIIVISHQRTAFTVRYFELTPILGPRGVYSTYARAIPNAEGVFRIRVINVNSKDNELPAGKIIAVASGHEPDSCASRPNSPNHQIQMGMKLTSAKQEQLSILVPRYEDIFVTHPKRSKLNALLTHKIITENSMPVYQKPRRIPQAWEQDIDAQVRDMLDKRIVQPTESLWNSPIIPVKRRDSSRRFVWDSRKFNDITKKDTYPLPHIKDVLDKMAGARYWMTLYAASAYWSMPSNESDKEKTTFPFYRANSSLM